MNVERKSLDGTGAAIMTLVCMVLGLHQVAIKIAAPDIAPILQIAIRSGLSAVLIGILIVWRREGFSLRDGTLLPGILLGIAFSVEFIFVAEGLRYTSASHMSVFLYTAPIFTALMLHRFLPAERLYPLQWLGIGLAFCGIATTFGGSIFQSGIDGGVLRGDILAILGGIAWSSTTVIIRCSRLSDAPATKTLLYQLVAAFILLHAYAVGSGQAGSFSLTATALASVLFQAIVITFAIYLAWFSLLRRYNASQLSVFLFMTPLFGVSFGVLLMHDPINIYFAIGALLVLMGLTLVSKAR
jgi:drug/metabolite transporter (DMT)-like permease